MKTIIRGALLFDAIPHEPLTTTARTIAGRVGITVRSAQRHLEELRRAGLVERDDPAKRRDPARWWRA